MSKGSMSMGAVVLLVVGIVAAALIVGGVLSPTAEEYDNSTRAGLENASNNTNYATCVANCREDHPGDRGDFMSCRTTQGCEPR